MTFIVDWCASACMYLGISNLYTLCLLKADIAFEMTKTNQRSERQSHTKIMFDALAKYFKDYNCEQITIHRNNTSSASCYRFYACIRCFIADEEFQKLVQQSNRYELYAKIIASIGDGYELDFGSYFARLVYGLDPDHLFLHMFLKRFPNFSRYSAGCLKEYDDEVIIKASREAFASYDE